MQQFVCEKTNLIGPSLDSVFIACHKYYSRKKDLSQLNCQALSIYEIDLKKELITYPCYVKAPCLMCSHLQFIANDEEEMKSIIEIMKKELIQWGGMFFDFFKAFISKERYPYAHQPIVVIEELVVDYKQCAVEGWVDSCGNIHIWAISDINYHEGKERAQNCYSMPSITAPEVQAQMITTTTQTIESHGIKSGFFNVDPLAWNGEKPCKIIEVNGRAASLYYLMHQKCFNANLYKAMIFLCLKRDRDCYLESPIAKLPIRHNTVVGGLFFVVTFGKGNTNELLDFNKIEKMLKDKEIYGLELFTKPGAQIRDNGTAGFRMAKFYLFWLIL